MPLAPLNEDAPAVLPEGMVTFNVQVKQRMPSCDGFADESARRSKSARFQDLRYTKFTIGGIPGVKHAVFIPDTQTVTAQLMDSICIALDREMPSMFLCGVSSLCHPYKMSTAQLRKCPGFAPLMSEVRSSLGLQKETPEWAADSEATSRKIVDVLDHVLETKIASSVSNIATAAYRTNVWTLTGPRMSNFEVLLQQCIAHGETDVFRLVVAHMQDKSYMESIASKQLMKDLFERSQAMPNDLVDASHPINLSGDLWDPAVNTANPEFAEHGYDYWSFDSLDQRMTTGHPITLWPWPYGDLFFLFYREENIRGAATADVDWEFTTKARLDVEAVPFAPDTVAPMGYVFIGSPYCWQPQVKKRILHGIQLANPTVILDNTPNFAKQAAIAVKTMRKVWDRQALASCRPYLSSERPSAGGIPSPLELLQSMSPAKLMKQIELEFDSSGMSAEERIALSDVVGLLDAAKRRPQAFRETVCTVDPLADSAENMISQVMSVFTSHYCCPKEPSATEIHQTLAFKGWGLHLKLQQRAERLRRYANGMVLVITVMMLLSSSLAMVKVYLTLLGARIRHEMALNTSLVLLPILVLLLVTIQGSFQLGQAWAAVHMGSSRVVSEIFHFLGNVEPYSGSPAANQKRFMKRLREMVKRLSVSGIREEDLIRSHSGLDKAGAQAVTDMEALDAEIRRSLYGTTAPCCPCRTVRDMLRSWGILTWSSLLDVPDQRDLTAPVNAESYMEMRVAPLKRYYCEWVRSASRLRMVLHCILMLVLSASVGLGATDYSIWIPVSLATATFVQTLINWLTPMEIFVALNNALTVLHKLDLCWQGSEVRENRSEATKRRLIMVTESLALNVERAVSRGAAVLDFNDEIAQDSDGEDSRFIEVIPDGKRSTPISVPMTPANIVSGAITPVSNNSSLRRQK